MIDRVCLDRAAAFVMRIDALIAGRNYCVAGQPTLRHDRRVDSGLEHFRSQARSIQIEIAVALGLSALEHANAGFESEAGDFQRLGDLFHFETVLGFALRPERIALDLHAVAFSAELIQKQRGEICRHDQ